MIFFQNGSCFSIDFCLNFIETASNMSGMTVDNWRISLVNSIRVINNNDLRGKGKSLFWSIIVSLTHNISSFYILNSKLYIKSNIISRNSHIDELFVHFNRFNFWCETGRSKCNVHFWSQNTCFNSSNRNCTDSCNFIDILNWNP